MDTTQIQANAQAIIDALPAINAEAASKDALLASDAAQIADLSGKLASANAAVQALQLIIDSQKSQMADLSGRLSADVAAFAKFRQDVMAGRIQPNVLSNLHYFPLGAESETTWHDAGGTKADSNPSTTVKPHGTQTWAHDPTGSTTLLEFQPAAANDNIYDFIRNRFPAATPEFLADERLFQIPAKYVPGNRCLEFESQYTEDGVVHNMAYQFNVAANVVRIFNFAEPDSSKKWVPVSSIPMPDFSHWVDVRAEFRIDQANKTTTHLGIWLNGTWYPVNVTFPAGVHPVTERKFTTAVQLDSQGARAGVQPPVCGVLIGKTNVRYL